jgi:signal transduction histidine kinase
LLWLAAAYAVTGRLALLLAVPPGYATPIFPPAGIAAGAMLMAGPATLPGTFLGSLLLNLWAGHALAQHLDRTTIAAAIAIAVASSVQAGVAGAAMRRLLGYPAALDNGRDVGRFLLLTPLCCLTSATLSLIALYSLGVVAWPALGASWVSWWIGDTLGVLVALPLILVAIGEPSDLWRRRALPVALPMLACFALFVAIFARVNKWEHDEALLDFRLLSREIVDKLRAGLAEQQIFIEQLERSFTGPVALSRAEFRHLVQNLLLRSPTIQEVGWAPRVNLDDRLRFEAAQQRDFPGFEIRQWDASGKPDHATDRPQFYPVTYVEPIDANRDEIGLDLISDRTRQAAVAEAIATGTLTTTAPLAPAEGHGDQPCILLVFPVVGGPNGPGIVEIALKSRTFLERLLVPLQGMIDIRLVDLDSGIPFYQAAAWMHADPAYEETFAFGRRRYAVQTAPSRSYLEAHRRWQSWGVLVAGVFGTGLLGALLMLGTGYARRIQTVVVARTRDLAETNRRLQLEIEDRQQAEAALRQAQRMEAIGRLTGGVAHDFNNLLTVVSGNAELLREEAADDRAVRRASAILRAAERGERLTRQLLAFSRRQTPQPEAVALAVRMRELADMVTRSLRADIELAFDMQPGLWPVAVDPAELERALLNIAANARDAMPKGGKLHIVARNRTCAAANPGDFGVTGEFVELTLSDTGVGMTPEVAARAFEPYYTTKAVGVGSGLGLFQVYGFARESGGAAAIESAPGQGTTVTLLLPRAGRGLASPRSAATAPGPRVSARILFIADDPEVAQVTAELLQQIGCDPVEANGGEAALRAVADDPAVALVLADIVMPGRMSGLDLARELRRRHPEMPVLLATGYSEYAATTAEGVTVVAKPYHREALAAAIRDALDPGRRAASA